MLSEPDFKEKKIILVFSQNGDKISFKNDNIVITNSENEIKFQLSCYRLFAIFIVGGFTLTSGIIQRSKKFGFSIVFFSQSFKVYDAVNYKMEGNTLLRLKQYTNTNNLPIAKQIIINKIENQKETLKKLRDKSLKDGIKILEEKIETLKNEDMSLYEIMGIEGTCAKVYFNRIFKEFDWKGRQPRLKRDEINLLLDIGYTVLFNFLEAILNLYGFDIYKGNLHQEFYKRKSLVCDIIEPFRPIIDYKIRKMINLGQTKNYKFQLNNNQYSINWKDSSDFVKNILEEIMENKITVFRYIQQYYRWFMKEKPVQEFPNAELKNNDNN
ncbi:MAG: type V CRISPR-associated endonuclease Cas1 [Candidatus Gastranaerophilales bacterium]|nr:type V CRISPR-associated endonuclease Cas1 [Candidatus Gastranaerophilales bacterium]